MEAAQRIQGLTLTTAIRDALFHQKTPKVKSLPSTASRYPERGPGQMWEMMTELLRQRGYPVPGCSKRRKFTRIAHDGRQVTFLVSPKTSGATGFRSFSGSDFISSMPIARSGKSTRSPGS